MKHVVSVSLDEETVFKIREILRDKSTSFRNKSHVVEEAIKRMHGGNKMDPNERMHRMRMKRFRYIRDVEKGMDKLRKTPEGQRKLSLLMHDEEFRKAAMKSEILKRNHLKIRHRREEELSYHKKDIPKTHIIEGFSYEQNTRKVRALIRGVEE